MADGANDEQSEVGYAGYAGSKDDGNEDELESYDDSLSCTDLEPASLELTMKALSSSESEPQPAQCLETTQTDCFLSTPKPVPKDLDYMISLDELLSARAGHDPRDREKSTQHTGYVETETEAKHALADNRNTQPNSDAKADNSEPDADNYSMAKVSNSRSRCAMIDLMMSTPLTSIRQSFKFVDPQRELTLFTLRWHDAGDRHLVKPAVMTVHELIDMPVVD